MALSEARSGAFVFRDTLFAEVAEGKRHARASTSELKDLLLPKKGSAPPKDQVAHWYEAQLLHYGLPRTKDKNAAKVRLTSALAGGKLEVPSDVLKIEAGLKKEYAGLLRKEKAASKTQKAQPDTPNAKKRKADDAQGASTKVSVKVGDVAIEVDHQTIAKAQAAAKKQKKDPASKETASSLSKPAAKKASDQPIKKTKTTAAKSSPVKPTTPIKPKSKSAQKPSTSIVKDGAAIGNHPRPKQTARRGKPFDSAAHRAAPAQGRSPPSLASSLDDDAPPPYTEYDEEGYDDIGDRDNYREQAQQGVVQISGQYSIQTSHGDGDLSLRLSHSHDQLWGTFTIDDRTGLIRLDGVSDLGRPVRTSFGWRSEHVDGGGYRFGKGCDGWLEFDGQGSVRGVFHGLANRQDVDFDGEVQEDYSYEDEEERHDRVEGLIAEWHEYPDRAYGRA